MAMTLTATQKTQLHKDLLQYLVNNQFQRTAQAFSQEAGVALDSVNKQGRSLQAKWRSILNLQKKVINLEEKVVSLEEELAKGGGAGKQANNVKIQDMYLPKQPAKLQLEGHRGPITSMAFHPLFSQLASASQDGTIKIWEFQTGNQSTTLRGHTNKVNCVNYDQQGKFIVSSSSDLTIKLWDINNEYKCTKTFYGHEHNVSYVEFVMEGDYLLSCSRDKTIRLWEINTGHCKRTYRGHQGWVRKVATSVNGKTFVSCSDDQTVIVWNIDKEEPFFRFVAHSNVIQNIMLIEGQHSSVLINSEFLKSKFSQQTKLNALKKLEKQGVNGISAYQQMFIITSGRDNEVRLFASHSGQLLHIFPKHDNWVRGLALHPTGKYLYTASDDHTLRIWQLNFAKQKKKIQAHKHFISTVKFHPKYGVLATAGNDQIVKIWALK